MKQEDNSLDMLVADTYRGITTKIGMLIKKAQEKQGISLRKLYEDTSISIAVVSDMIHGVKTPRVETLIKLMFLLKVPFESIFNKDILPEDVNKIEEIESLNPEEMFYNRLGTKNTFKCQLKELLAKGNYNPNEIEKIVTFAEFIEHSRNQK